MDGLTAPVACLGEFVRQTQRAGRGLASRGRAQHQSTLFHGLANGAGIPQTGGDDQKPCTRNGAFGDPTQDAIRRSVTECCVDGPCQSFASLTTNQRTMTMYRPGGMMVLSRLWDRTARYPSTSQSVNHINHIGLSMISITYDGGEHPTQTRSQPTGR
jgi:hypothetical protein